MPNNIFHKRSLTPGSVPTTSSLNVGEIAINVPDGKIFVEKSGSAGQSIETVLVSNTTTDIGILTLSGSLILSGSGTGSVLDVSAGNVDFDFDTLSFSGSAAITGSLIVTGGIKGSLTGTASYASQSLSSSYALSASYSTIALNAFMATSSSYAVSASWAPSSGGGAAFPYTGSARITGSLGVTGSINIKAAGALSTDIPFQVRNSANTANIITITGKGQIWSNGAGFISSNTSYGELALTANTTGPNNTAFGYNTLTTNTTSGQNTGVGWGALQLTAGAGNTAIGYGAGQINAAGFNNVYIGYAAGQYGTTADNCIFIGFAAGQSSNATNGIFIGQTTSTTGGNGTVAIGASAGAGTGGYNVSVGQSAGAGMTTGNFNIHLGYRTVGSGVTTGNYNTIIGGDSVVGAVSNTAVLSDGAGNIAIRKDASHYVGIGYPGTATLGAKLDVKAQGALSTDIAFRVRNSADTANLISVNGAGTTTITGSLIVTGGITGVPSGIFGISNSSGVYTYYTTLTLAMTAASSGQVIEMFADVTETGAVSVTLKTGVNINGNGHTYTLSNSGTSNALIDNGVAVSCEIHNIKFIRTLGTTASNVANMCLSITSTTSEIKCSGVFFRNTNGTCILNQGNLWGVSAVGTNSSSGVLFNTGNLYDSYIESTNSNAIYANTGNVINCRGIANTSGFGIYVQLATGNIYNSYGKSSTGAGLDSGGGKFFHSIGISTTGNAISTSSSGTELHQCIGISTSGAGISGNGYFAYQCKFISSSGYGTASGTSAEHYDCSHESTSSVAVFGYVGLKLYRGVAYSKWNNAGGHAFQQWSSGNSSVLNNVFLRVTNASAACIDSGGVAATISYSHNSYLGATTPISSFITQTLTNTEDNQGNIKL
jgi:hypothetical protein